MKRLRTNGSNLKSHLRKIGYILCAETIQSTCVQSSSINYHTVIQNGKWKLATKEKKSFTHWRLDTYFLITLKNYYYQKLRNIHFSPVHTLFYGILYYIFHVSLSRSLSSCILNGCLHGKKTQNQLTEEKHSCNAKKIGWCRTWSYFSIYSQSLLARFQVTCFSFLFISTKFPSVLSLYKHQIKDIWEVHELNSTPQGNCDNSLTTLEGCRNRVWNLEPKIWSSGEVWPSKIPVVFRAIPVSFLTFPNSNKTLY